MRTLGMLFTIALLTTLIACGDDGGTTDTGAGTDTGTATDTGTGADGATDGAIGTECFVNVDCPDDERCECTEAAGCFCLVGARGEGVNGVDVCETGNDCASALCVEGPSDDFYCSDVCESEDDCTGMLPRCLGGLGICARIPPA